jgi:hypothetical protein
MVDTTAKSATAAPRNRLSADVDEAETVAAFASIKLRKAIRWKPARLAGIVAPNERPILFRFVTRCRSLTSMCARSYATDGVYLESEVATTRRPVSRWRP